MKIGIISDTHGLIRPGALEAMKGVAHIIHAGDVGGPEVIQELEKIAPVTAVRGNMDGGDWAAGLPATQMLELEGRTLYVLHDLYALDLDPLAAGIRVVISGHTHQPAIKQNNGILYLNPGSASYQRRGNPLSIGILILTPESLMPRIVNL
jgi:putative phosphoesterase